MSKIIQRVCPSCQTDNHNKNETNYSKDEWKVKKCSQCNFVYLENTPIYEALSKEFAWEKTSDIEKQERKRKEPLKQILSDYLKLIRKKYLKRNKLAKLINQYFHTGNVLDIGCGTGAILRNLEDRYIPYGIEISEYLAKEGNKFIEPKGGYILHDNALSGVDKFEENFFEGIIMSAFLEHEIEPVLLLKSCFRALKDNGKAIIKVPNYGSLNRVVRGKKWCGFRYPDHVNYFTPKSLKKACNEAGFTIQKFNLLDKHPFSDNMWMVIVKNPSK
jgi:SAM-dependent methyltransferase